MFSIHVHYLRCVLYSSASLVSATAVRTLLVFCSNTNARICSSRPISMIEAVVLFSLLSCVHLAILACSNWRYSGDHANVYSRIAEAVREPKDGSFFWFLLWSVMESFESSVLKCVHIDVVA